MRLVVTLLLVMWGVGCLAAERPGLAVLSSATGATVKITDIAGYKPGSDVSYQIRHWPDGALFASGTVQGSAIKTDQWGLHVLSVENLSPKLWQPDDPQLYEITVESEGHSLGRVRFGFRTFEVKGDKFYLNGRPTLLRGVPINPPGRDLPDSLLKDRDFIAGYIKLLESANVNMIRTEPEEWLDVCDELGMMLFAGHYGGGGSGPIAPDFERRQPFYRDLLLRLASHPAVVIYVLSNEVDYNSPNSTWKQYLTKVYDDARLFDTTRPIIGNAGFGHGAPGEIFDVHRYAGWYYGNISDWPVDATTYVKFTEKTGQPLTITECVAAYTSDAGDYLTMGKQLSMMTKWVGTASNHRAAAAEYQSELVKHVTESMRRYRTDKSHVAGIMPFTYFLGWAHAQSAEDIVIKPAFETLKTAFQPVLLSPECWHRNLYAGDTLKLRLCLSNDDDQGRDLGPTRAVVEMVSADGKVISSDSVSFGDTPYYSNNWMNMSLPTPADLPRGLFDVKCKLFDADQSLVSANEFQVSIAPRSWCQAKSSAQTPVLFDPSGRTAEALGGIGVKFSRTESLQTLPKDGLLIIGECALEAGKYPDKKSVIAFLDRGGKILCLRQEREKWESDWLPANFTMKQRPPYRPLTYIQPRDNAALFDGMTERDLRWWNELGRAEDGTPDIGPVLTAFRPASASDLRKTRIWASCDPLLSAAAIVEIIQGKGRVVLSQFRAIERVDNDPCAAKLLGNLISYSAGQGGELFDLNKTIHWDLRAFQSGAFVSSLQGLLPHSQTYKHRGTSKGRLGDDHRIDGFTLVGNYDFSSNGWILPIPDPKTIGWGIFYGSLSRQASRFIVNLINSGDKNAELALKLDGKLIGLPITIPAGAAQTVTFPINRAPGPVTVALRGDQTIVIKETRFE